MGHPSSSSQNLEAHTGNAPPVYCDYQDLSWTRFEKRTANFYDSGYINAVFQCIYTLQMPNNVMHFIINCFDSSLNTLMRL